MNPLRLGLLAYPIERPASVAAFAAKLDRWLEAAAGHADLVLLPEYACVELGTELSRSTAADEVAELRAMIAAAPEILEAMREAARR